MSYSTMRFITIMASILFFLVGMGFSLVQRPIQAIVIILNAIFLVLLAGLMRDSDE